MPPATTLTPSTPVTIIEPERGWGGATLGELWEGRELLLFFVWRDIRVRYAQAMLGIVWAVLVPFAHMVVFTIIFSGLAGLPSDGLPAPIFYYTALLPWSYFATAVTFSSQSLVANSAMLTKVYFPRMLMPAASCLAGIADFVIAFCLLLLMMAFYRLAPGLEALLLPFLFLIAMTTAVGVGLFFSALNVKFRDIRFVIPLLIQLWMYVTVILPFSSIPERFGAWRYLYGLNPMAGVVEGFRWVLLNRHMQVAQDVIRPQAGLTIESPWPLIVIGIPCAVGILVLGLVTFRRMERQFADVI